MTIRVIPGFGPNTRNDACSICGRGPGKENKHNPVSPNRPVVDLDTEIDMEGHFQICLDCAAEIGAAVGMISEEQAAGLREDANIQKSRTLAAETERDAARKALDALSADYATRPPVKKKAAAKKQPAGASRG